MVAKFLLSASLLFLPGLCRAQDADSGEAPAAAPAAKPVIAEETPEAEYRRMVDELNQRYEDFFVHEDERKRHYEEIGHGVPEVKTRRNADLAAREAARLDQVAHREAAPDTTELERAWEAEQEKQRRHFDRHRQEYIDERTSVERIKNSARKIPENKDAGLE